MIDESVLYLAKEFSEHWSERFVDHPRCQLDFSWPSIGIVDRILAPLRYKAKFADAEELLIAGAAAYIGGIVHDTWALFPDHSKISLTFTQHEYPDIELEARGGRFLPHRGRFIVKIASTLKSILSNPPSPFPILPEHSVHLSIDDNIVSLFSRSLICGLTPFGEGGWNDIDLMDMKRFINAADIVAAESCASYYAQAFPGETLGTDPALYRSQLILPPFGFREPFPGCFAARGLCEFFKDHPFSTEEILNLAINLSSSPDDMISVAGFLLAASEGLAEPLPRLLTARELLGERILTFKPAIIFFKELKEEPGNWLEYLAATHYETAQTIIASERALDLLPFLTLPFSCMENEVLIPTWAALNFSEIEAARQQIEFIAGRGDAGIDLIMQGIFLDLHMERLDNAEQDLAILSGVSFPPGSARTVLYHELCGIYAFKRRQYEQASEHLAAAVNALESDPIRCARVGTYLVSALIARSAFEEALGVCDLVLHHNSGSILTMLNRCYLLGELNQTKEAERQFDRLARTAPLDLRVFLQLRDNLSWSQQKDD